MPYLGNIPATQFAELKYQDFTGGTGTSFTLNDPVGSAQELEVFVNNVRQEPGVAYTVSGTALTMTGSIVASDDFYVVFQGKSIPSGQIPEKQSNGDYTFDDGTLFVDASTNRIGVGVTDPSQDIDLVGTGNSGSGSVRAGGTGSGTQSAFIAQAQFGSASFGTYGSYPAILNSSNNPVVYFDTNNGGRAIFDEGVTFNGDTATANALDDYEEGTWTPAYTGTGGATTHTYTQQMGRYVKVGDIVHVYFVLQTSATSGGSGSVQVTGLPYTISSASIYVAGSIGFSSGFATDDCPTGILGNYGSTSMYIYKKLSNSNQTNVAVGDLVTGNGNEMYASISYRAN